MYQYNCPCSFKAFCNCVSGPLNGTEEVIVALGWDGSVEVPSTEIYNVVHNQWRSGAAVPSTTPTLKAVRGSFEFLLITSGTTEAAFFDTLNFGWREIAMGGVNTDILAAKAVAVVEAKDYNCN